MQGVFHTGVGNPVNAEGRLGAFCFLHKKKKGAVSLMGFGTDHYSTVDADMIK